MAVSSHWEVGKESAATDWCSEVGPLMDVGPQSELGLDDFCPTGRFLDDTMFMGTPKHLI